MKFPTWKRWQGKGWRDFPILLKVMGIALGMAAFASAALLWQLLNSYTPMETAEVEGHARFIARTVATAAAPLVSSNHLSSIRALLQEAVHYQPAEYVSVRSLEVWDETGNVLAKVADETPVPPGGRMLEESSWLPGGVPGSVHITMYDRHLEYERAWHTRRIIATTGIIGFLGVTATWWLMRIVLRPIHALVHSARAVQEGRYDTRAPVLSMDEAGQLAAAFNEMTAALQQKEFLNQHLLRKVIAASEEERKRVSRELHDQTGQALTSLIASLTALEAGASADQLAEARALATRTLGEVHDICHRLRPSALDDLGLVAALENHCRRMGERFRVNIDFAAIGLETAPRLPGEIEVALYRIVQEALTNAVRHGQASSVEVLLQRKQKSLLAVIEDDGRGFEAKDWRARCLREDRLGLLGMEERVTMLRGELRVESSPGSGTRLFVEIPVGETGCLEFGS